MKPNEQGQVTEDSRATLELLYNVSREIAAPLDLRTVLQRVVLLSMKYVGAISGSIIVLDDKGQPAESALITEEGFHDNTTQQLRATFDHGLAGWVTRNRQAVLVPNTDQDERWLIRFEESGDRPAGKSALSAPILAREELVGVITLVHPAPGFFGWEHLELVQAIGNLAGTAIRHAELFERLEAAHQRYRELFEDSIDPILITDWEGTIQEANRQAVLITEVSSEKLRGTGIERLLVVDPAIVGEYYEKLSSGETYSYETNLVAASGREIPVQVYARKVHIDGVSHLQWILRDITERKNLDNLRNDLISMVYHDLRSPLANIVSSLDVLEAMLPENLDPTQKSLVDIAIRSTERIQRLTNSLLDLRRLEAGQPVANQQSISPAVLANEAVENVMPSVHNKSQEVTLLVPEGILQVWVDADMIRRVLTNLLENAVKYTPAGSQIYVGAREEKDQVLMWVQDTGPGIPLSERERIFDKYTRLHGKGSPRGLGLGLAFCRMAVQAHGGQIWVEDGPEAGACFKFTLPTADRVVKTGESGSTSAAAV